MAVIFRITYLRWNSKNFGNFGNLSFFNLANSFSQIPKLWTISTFYLIKLQEENMKTTFIWIVTEIGLRSFPEAVLHRSRFRRKRCHFRVWVDWIFGKRRRYLFRIRRCPSWQLNSSGGLVFSIFQNRYKRNLITLF